VSAAAVGPPAAPLADVGAFWEQQESSSNTSQLEAGSAAAQLGSNALTGNALADVSCCEKDAAKREAAVSARPES